MNTTADPPSPEAATTPVKVSASPWLRVHRKAVIHWSIGILLGTLIVGSAMVARHKTKDRFVPRNLGPIVPGLVYRSGQIDQRLIGGFLDEYGIQRVVVMSNYEYDDPDHVAEKEACEARNIEVIRIAMPGNGVGTPEQYAQVLALIHESAQQSIPTLVHCSAGSERTGGTTASYRMLFEDVSGEAAYREAKSYGWQRHKNPELPGFVNDNLEGIAGHLVAAGVIETLPDPLPRFGPR